LIVWEGDPRLRTSTCHRKFEPFWGLCQATIGLPFMVQRNGFAIVAIRVHAQPTVRLVMLCVPASGRPHLIWWPVGIDPRFPTAPGPAKLTIQGYCGKYDSAHRTESPIPARSTRSSKINRGSHSGSVKCTIARPPAPPRPVTVLMGAHALPLLWMRLPRP
jgi:hypothetical protein